MDNKEQALERISAALKDRCDFQKIWSTETTGISDLIVKEHRDAESELKDLLKDVETIRACLQDDGELVAALEWLDNHFREHGANALVWSKVTGALAKHRSKEQK